MENYIVPSYSITPSCSYCYKVLHPARHLEVNDYGSDKTLEFCGWGCVEGWIREILNDNK